MSKTRDHKINKVDQPLKKNSKQNNSAKLIALLLLVSAGLLFLLYTGSENTSSESAKNGFGKNQIPAAVRSPKFEKTVNHHLLVTGDTIENEQKRIWIENINSAKDLSSTSSQPNYKVPTEGIELNVDNRATELADLLGRGAKKENPISDPNDVIQNEIFNQQLWDEYSKTYREEYAKQFVENARRGGYKVILNDDFKVISVTPIKKTIPNRNESILNFHGGGVQ
jgi:hypothetical protein